LLNGMARLDAEEVRTDFLVCFSQTAALAAPPIAEGMLSVAAAAIERAAPAICLKTIDIPGELPQLSRLRPLAPRVGGA
jgi:hypothetical protein